MMISAATARHFWPELKDPAAAIGKRLGIGAAMLSEDKNILKTETLTDADVANFPSYEVIGIARDTRSGWVWEKDETSICRCALTARGRLPARQRQRQSA